MLCSLTFIIYNGILYKHFHTLQTNQALQSYINMLFHLVAFLFCNKDNYFILFLASILTLIHDIQHLSPPTQLPPPIIQNNFDQHTLKIVDLLIDIQTYFWDLFLENLIENPTICFLTLSSIKADDSWAQATEIIPFIAKLMFCIWSMFLFCIYVDQEKTGILCKQYQVLER